MVTRQEKTQKNKDLGAIILRHKFHHADIDSNSIIALKSGVKKIDHAHGF